MSFLNGLDIPKVESHFNEALKMPLTLLELEDAIKNSQNGKSPGNDGFGREVYIVFWKNLSGPLLESFIDGKKKESFLPPNDKQ